ncbi:polysaccharide deacetylase family protein [Salidesulfovibrio onnuriiensis]|uniref:polysaccharide deacetylase family protein n=1 Tax=Salidesulfovibrio onnuriiensis TaxID=2583823 RepID=UPI0011C88094|nr:polysaccharide deacetylase family protein [Salidesulfovibrio onnuriiensis]
MIVKNTLSSLWLKMPADVPARLDRVLAEAPEGRIFFRADDVAVPGRNMSRMLEVFRESAMPLCMAVVPAWLHDRRWREIRSEAGDSGQWCWHQHGWRHRSHQTRGKKGEFGDERSPEAKKTDLSRGKAKLQALMGKDFEPYFTPPWNRFDAETGAALKELGFRAVSRSAGELKKVPLPEGLPDLFINVDLHTRNEPTPEEGWDALLAELKAALATGRCGVMLHHQRANALAFDFLDLLLKKTAGHKHLQPAAFRDLVCP